MAETIGAIITIFALALIIIMVSSAVVDSITEIRIRNREQSEAVRSSETRWPVATVPVLWKYRMEKVWSNRFRAEPQNIHRKIGRKRNG